VAQLRLALHSCPLTSGTGRLPFCPVDGRVAQTPLVVLGHLNHVLSENVPDGETVTALYGLLDPSAAVLQYASAGHPIPRLWRAGTQRVESAPGTSGPPLGAGLTRGDLQCNFTMDPGDVLVCFTSGVTEARNEHGEPFGVGRLDAAIGEGTVQGARAVKRRVLIALERFLTGEGPSDDVTLLVIERKV
jgi:sigma-B regulation protein RsbU (phosphoserine phosphatase)